MRSPWRCPAPWLAAPSANRAAARAMVVAMESLVRGGAARFARRVRAAAAQREAGSMFGFVSETGGVNVSEARHASPEAVSAAGIACVEALGEVPALAEQLAFVLDSASSAGSLEDAGPATAARARVLAARLRAAAGARAPANNVRKSRSFVPSLAADRGARRWNRRPFCSRTSEPGTAPSPRGAGSPATRGLAPRGRGGGGGGGGGLRCARAAATPWRRPRLAPPRRGAARRTRTTRLSQWTTRRPTNRHRHPPSRSAPTPLTGPSDPCWIEASHESRPDARRARRAVVPPPPPSTSPAPRARRGSPARCRWARTAHWRRGRHRGTHRRALGAAARRGGRGSARRRRSRRRRRRRRRRVRVWLETRARRPRRVARRSRRRRGDAGDGGGARPRVRARRATRRDVRGVSERHIRVEPGVRRRRRPRGGSADGASAATLGASRTKFRSPIYSPTTRGAIEGDGRGLDASAGVLRARRARRPTRRRRRRGHRCRRSLRPGADRRSGRGRRAPRWRRRRRRSAGLNEKGTRKKLPTKRKAKTLGVSRRPSRGAARTRWARGRPCERFAATTGTASISWSRCSHPARARLEHPRPLHAGARRRQPCVAEIAGGVLVAADAAADAAGDASLFRPRLSSRRRRSRAGPSRARDRAARRGHGEWKAMAAA